MLRSTCALARRWPWLSRQGGVSACGWMASIAGTLFIERGAGEAGALVPRMNERMGRGRHLVIFPEGTTTDGSRLERFHPRLFAAAQIDGVRVQPVAVRYGTNAVRDRIAPFIGDDALLPHLARLVRHPGLKAAIHLLLPREGSARPRRPIAEYSSKPRDGKSRNDG